MKRLDGKNVIIIGAGQSNSGGLGNGRAAAIRFAEEGANLFITAKHFSSAAETQKIIKNNYPSCQIFIDELDVTNETAVIDFFAKAKKALGPIDVIVNNVGIMSQSDIDLLTMNENDYDLMVNTNLKSAIYINKNAKMVMNKNGGSIIQTASIAGVVPGTNLYSLTKSSMIKIGQMFAKMYAKDGIRVNNIVLGKVDTPMIVNFLKKKTNLSEEEIKKSRDSSIPLKGGQGDAFDFANAALFLASDESKFITGANLPVDGGESLGYL